ncbi:MAG: PRC-barrel domain-containing protein [Bryobacterales bacterium]|nr:PRC-barrel domain-containing protein [Bryobacterales bacterium]
MHSLKETLKFKVHAEDDVFGGISDFYFDDHHWSIRYLVIDTGNWLPGRKVLISPTSAGEPDWHEKSVPVVLNRAQIENAPPISTERPVSRQHEEAISLYYGWPRYWSATGLPAPGLGGLPHNAPGLPLDKMAEAGNRFEESREARLHEDPNLRSFREVMGYSISATDSDIGHVEDFLADMKEWRIRKLVVDTRNWLPGKDVVVGIEQISEVNWEDHRVSVAITKAEVENSPAFEKARVFI